MNQKQREFLIKHIESHYRDAMEKLKKECPTKPSLNNYLIAAVLDGSVTLQPSTVLAEKVREKVLALGPDDTLVCGRSSRGGWGSGDKEEGDVSFPAEWLFVLPPGYEAALAVYEEQMTAWEMRQAELTATKETLVLKVQLGSDAVMNRLIEQADNLADLQLVNSRLLLTEGK